MDKVKYDHILTVAIFNKNGTIVYTAGLGNIYSYELSRNGKVK